MNKAADAEPSDWNSLYITGGIAALAAGILFRRNLGVEISIFSPQKQPGSIADWYALLQTNRLLGLAYLNIFDVVNYTLVSLMLLALCAALYMVSKSAIVIATTLGFLGIAAYFASNTALSLLALSDQYAAAATEAQRAPLLAAGQALLAINRFSSAGAGGYLSLLLIAAAEMIIALVMLRSALFNRVTAWVGILAGALDLAYCLAFAFLPVDGHLLAVTFIPAAGLFLMVWHILTGIRLYQMGRLVGKAALRVVRGER